MRLASAVAGLSFAYLVMGASPTHAWLDSGELTAAAVDLGVMHPPGAAGLGLLLRLGCALPLGSLGFRVAIGCAALAALALAALAAILLRRGVPAPVAAAACAWALMGTTFGRYGRVTEIYGFGALLTACVVLVLAAPDARHRPLALVSCAWGALALGELRFVLAPLALVVLVLELRSRPRPWWLLPLCALGLLPVLALPLSAARAPLSDWGHPDSLAALLDHLGARSIRAAYGDEIWPGSLPLWGVHLRMLGRQLAEDLGPLGVVVAGAGGSVLAWDVVRRWEARLVVFLTLACTVYALGINPMGLADRQNGSILALVLVGGTTLGLAGLGGERRWSRWALAGLLSACAIAAAPASWRDGVTTRSWAPHAHARRALQESPPGAVLLSQSDDLSAGLIAAAVLEGARPDLVAVAAQHLHKGLPPALAGDDRARAIFAAAGEGSSEADRIMLAVGAVEGSVGLEQPRTGVLRALAWTPAGGDVQLAFGRALAPGGPLVGRLEGVLAALEADAVSGLDRRRAQHLIVVAVQADLAAGSVDASEGVVTLTGSLERFGHDHAATWVTLGALLARLGRLPEAIAATRTALALEPARPLALTNLALYLASEPATRPEALAVAERAVALRPWRSDAWARLSEVALAAGERERAETARARARGPVTPEGPVDPGS